MLLLVADHELAHRLRKDLDLLRLSLYYGIRLHCFLHFFSHLVVLNACGTFNQLGGGCLIELEGGAPYSARGGALFSGGMLPYSDGGGLPYSAGGVPYSVDGGGTLFS